MSAIIQVGPRKCPECSTEFDGRTCPCGYEIKISPKQQAYEKRMLEEADAPAVVKGKTGYVISLGEHYFLEVVKGQTLNLRVDDTRSKKGTLCTVTVRLSDPSKIASSNLAKPIRDALKKIYVDPEKYSDYQNRLMLLIENSDHYFKITDEELEAEKDDEENPGAIVVRLTKYTGINFFRDQLNEAYLTVLKTVEVVGSMDTKDTRNPIVTPTIIPSPSNLIDINTHTTQQSNIGETSVPSAQSVQIHYTTRIRSRECRQWMADLYLKDQGKTVGGDAINSAILVLEAHAMKKPARTLYNRMAPDGNDGIWWDMSNELGQAIHITKDGWYIENNPPQIFRHYSHQEPLPYPAESGSLLPLLDYIMLSDPGQALLSIITPISYLIPGVPHVIEFVSGAKGSTKSSRHRFNRRIIDPSSTPLLTLPKDIDQMVQHGDHHYLLCYDNVTKIDEDQSDLMCRIITGLGFSKRMLYTDDDTVIRQLKRCININGINLPADKPDLLDRSVIQIADMIPDSMRKTEAQMDIKMAYDAPRVIRAMLDVLVTALNLYDTIKPIRNNRMADFTYWGCAITEAMGIKKAYFENAYYDNINTQNMETVKSNPVAQWLISFMEFNNFLTYTGSANELLQVILDFAKETYERDLNWVDGWPKGATPFGKKLTEVIPSLKSIGYNVTYAKSGSRKYVITKLVDADADKNEKGSVLSL